MRGGLIDRFMSIAEAGEKNGQKEVVHHITRNAMRKYRLEIKDILESMGISFYEDKPFRERMIREYHEKNVSRGILELKIIEN